MMLVDYFSKYVEVGELINTSYNTGIKIMKHNFALHGIPITLISDGGTEFPSKEFSNFDKSYEFNHVTLSLTYAQSNGMAERHIQITRKIF